MCLCGENGFDLPVRKRVANNHPLPTGKRDGVRGNLMKKLFCEDWSYSGQQRMEDFSKQGSPQRHGEHRVGFFMSQSGDGDWLIN